MGVGRRRKGDMPERKTLQLSIHNEHMYSRKQKSSIFRGKIQNLDETLHAERYCSTASAEKSAGNLKCCIKFYFEIFFF